MIPRLISGWPNVADSAAMRKSQAIASSQPPPSAIELTAAIVAVRDFSIPRMNACACSTISAPSPSSIFVNSLMSAPAANVKMFDDAITIARGLPSTCFQASASSLMTGGDSGFIGGRLSHDDRDVVARLEQQRLLWPPRRAAGRGRSPGRSSCPSRPWATSGAGQRRRSSRPTPPGRVLERLDDLVEAALVGAANGPG